MHSELTMCDVGAHCEICSGKWRTCHRCGGRGQSLPTHCPERKLTEKERAGIVAGTLNYSAGAWRHYAQPMRSEPRAALACEAVNFDPPAQEAYP